MQKDLPFEYICPYCDAILDSLASFDEIKVKHDDFTICATCAGVCVWVIIGHSHALRKSTEQDIDRARKIGLYKEIEQLVDFVKGKDSRIIRPSN